MKKLLQTAISWYQTSLLPQFVSLAMITAILFVLAAQIVTQNYFDTSLSHAIDAVESDTTLMQAQNIDRQLHNYINSVYEIIIDTDVYNAAKALENSDLSQNAKYTLALRQKIQTYTVDTIVGITVVLPNRQMVFYNRLFGNWQGLPWFSGGLSIGGSNDALYALYNSSVETRAITLGFQPYVYRGTGTYLLHMAYPLINLYSSQKCGVLVVSFNTKTLRAMVNSTRLSGQDMPLFYNILTSADGFILAHPDETQIGKTFCLEKAPAKNPDPQKLYITDDVLVNNEPIGRLGLQLYSITDKQITARQARSYTFVLVITISIIVLLQLAAFYLMMRRMMCSVKALQKGLETVQSNKLDIYVTPVGKHEVAQSIRAFNKMAVRLKESEESTRLHAEKTIAAMEQQRIAEIKTLENQINSHFLYNILNSINHNAIRSGNLDVSRQIKHLSHVLRYTFEKSDGIVDASMEAQWLGEYLALQKLRFGSAFDYVVRVDPAVKEWPMRKLIVQPFVENSILHGFEGHTFGRFLTVEFAPYGTSRMRVTIRDNGNGIAPEYLEKLQAYIRCGQNCEKIAGIGLENACQRIRSYYKKKARMYLRSWAGVGTTVVLLLPRYESEP